jgi:hypothetical protein
LAATYARFHPFKGAFLAGVFTKGATTQLASLGFRVVYISYEDVVRIFTTAGVDARYDEATSDGEFHAKVAALKLLSSVQKLRLGRQLLKSRAEEVAQFMESLKAAILRTVERVLVLALYGKAFEAPTIGAAIAYIQGPAKHISGAPIHHYEVEIRYSNGDVAAGRYVEKCDAIAFLQQHAE